LVRSPSGERRRHPALTIAPPYPRALRRGTCRPVPPCILLRGADAPGQARMAVEERLDPRVDVVLIQVEAAELQERGGRGDRVVRRLETEQVGLVLLHAAEGCDRGAGKEQENRQEQKEQGPGGPLGERRE